MTDKRLAAAAEKFRRDMEKLNLGVSIKLDDGPWVEVTPDPSKPKAEKS